VSLKSLRLSTTLFFFFLKTLLAQCDAVTFNSSIEMLVGDDVLAACPIRSSQVEGCIGNLRRSGMYLGDVVLNEQVQVHRVLLLLVNKRFIIIIAKVCVVMSADD